MGRRCGSIVLCLMWCPTAWSSDYWHDAYQNFDVTTYVGSGYAASLARDLSRFDTTLARILQLPEGRLPTHIIELTREQQTALVGTSGSTTYLSSGYEVWVVTTGGDDPQQRYFGALFGYTSSLLMSGPAARSPYWFRMGVPQVFAATDFKMSQVITGRLSAGVAFGLRGKLIPMREFLRMQGGDPQLRDPKFETLFQSESWYLAREVYVEGKLRPEFSQYLSLLRQGKSEPDAFAASFKISYEDLDKLLLAGMREQAHQYVIDVPLETTDGQQVRKLTGVESKAMLAELSLIWNHRAEALRLAAEALQGDPANELALRVLSRGYLEDRQFAASLEAVNKLTALGMGSAAALTDSGEVLTRLGTEVSRNHASIAATADSLNRRAKESYERAIRLDPEYLRAWAGLAYLDGVQLDQDAARALAVRAKPLMEKHPDNAPLARALAIMCAQTGQSEAAFLFAQSWRENAPSRQNLDEAITFLASLSGQGGADNYNRGNAYIQQGDYDRAIKDYDEAIRLKADDARAFNNRGNAYYGKGDYQRAIQDYDQAIRLRADDAMTFHNRGNAYFRQRDYDHAIQDYDQAIRLRANDAQAFNDRGNAYAGKGDFDRAVQDYSEAIHLAADYAKAFQNRGSAYLKKGDYDRAMKDFDQAIRLKPDDPAALNSRCFARAIANKALEAALSDCNESLRLKPDSANTLDSRGFAYFRMGRYEKAIADFDEVMNRNPTAAGSLYLRGLAKRMRHDSADGDADIAAARTIDPKVADRYAGYGVNP